MLSSTLQPSNWFKQSGRAYARFRPHYPPSLAKYLADQVSDHRLALDVGCGNGQLTELLALHFATVIGLDSSAEQIAAATPHDRITYKCASAEAFPLNDKSAGLITAAQAAHWFDLPAFYQEAVRVGVPGAVVALISYGVLSMEPALNARFQKFYSQEIGPYWPPERKLVDGGYTTIAFPFEEITAPKLEIHHEWHLSQFLGYLLTWSAVSRANEAGKEDLLVNFATDIAELWGDPNFKHSISWPINMRIGTL